MRDPRYDILFEPVQIGPVVARNRFFQVPHCCGMGHGHPHAAAAMRGMKAEGGWAVVSTEECDIHHTSDVSPYMEQRLWDDDDIPQHQLMIDAVHAHGSLAAVELAHNGAEAPNLYSRSVPIAPSAVPVSSHDPIQARAMSRRDIRDIRDIYRKSAIRAKRAGFDIIYVYAAHMLTLPSQFLSRRLNHRTDEYGGSLQNRVRLLKELITDAKDAVGGTCAIAVRFMMDELLGSEGIQCEEEGIEIVSMLAELPDIWDVNISDWNNDSATSRFKPEGHQERYIKAVKRVTSKPVVGVGRFTSPDTMVSQIRRGVLDMIGAARPSIADPFLPRKIEEGMVEDVRECIGCNICVSGDFTITPIRCTQNPTMGEEWRRSWHPEILPPADDCGSILIIGGGPAGLECAVSLGKRGCKVTLADANKVLGGRVGLESALPGLSEWGRVRDHRLQQLCKLSNVELFPSSVMDVEHIAEFGAQHVVFATGAMWRRDGRGRQHAFAIPGSDLPTVHTPDDIMAGRELDGQVVIYDDDHYYMGGVIAEAIRAQGAEVTLVTPSADVSSWTHKTLEQVAIQRKLIRLGITIRTGMAMKSISEDCAEFRCVYSDRAAELVCDHIVLVTSRVPNDQLVFDFAVWMEQTESREIETVRNIGDCLAPATIAAAVYSGHQYARAFGEPRDDREVPFLRELVRV